MTISRFRYTTGKVDILFGFLAVVSLVLFMDQPSGEVFPAPAFGPYLMAAIAMVSTLLISLVASKGADLDRRCAEEYAFQIIANAAIIAIVTTMFAHAIWDMNALNRMGLPKPTSGQMIGVMVLSWSVGYAFYRIRGLKS